MCLKPPPSPNYNIINCQNHMCSTAINITSSSPLGSIVVGAGCPSSANGIMSLQEDDVHCQEQATAINEIGSPISDQMFEFCETDIFPETLQNSDVTCSSNCCCYEDNSSYTANISSFPPTINVDEKYSCHPHPHPHPHEEDQSPSSRLLVDVIKDEVQYNDIDRQNLHHQVGKKNSNATTSSSSTNTTPTTTSSTSNTTATTSATANIANAATATAAANNYNTGSNVSATILFDQEDTHTNICTTTTGCIDFSQFSAPLVVPYLLPTGSSSPRDQQQQQENLDDFISSVQILRQPGAVFTHASVVSTGGGLNDQQFHPPCAAQLVPPLMMPAPMFEEDCLSSIDIPPDLLRLNSASSCNFMDMPACAAATPLNCSLMNDSCPAAGGGIYTSNNAGSSSNISGSVLVGEIQPKGQLDHYRGTTDHNATGMFCADQHQLTRSVFNSGDIEIQAFSSSDGQQLVNGAASSPHFTTTHDPISAATAGLEDPTFKVGKLSIEQRREKIHRYMKKRNERNFSKKIKYACRKTLADSRPRVRGRFAKNNDDFGGNHHHKHISNGGNHLHKEDDYDHDHVTHVKDEEDVMVDSSEIFAHISGVNSFKFGYPIQSWN